ncbi:MAG: hypothetical protein ICV83_34925, partial [Cytophagales bacterium]|nr:hypothetical protein [Cytophagales bacterium]
MKQPVPPAPGRTNHPCRPQHQTSPARRNPLRTGWLTLCLLLLSLPLALAQDVLLGLA